MNNMTETMQAMVFEQAGQPLRAVRLPVPQPASGELLIAVEACGVCRTDLHIMDGDLDQPVLPLIPGHEIVGRVAACGQGVGGWSVGERVGVPWLGGSCGDCRHCCAGRENLCEGGEYTGYTRAGGYAQYTTARADFCLRPAESFDAVAAAPLLCAGLIGYRSYRMAGDHVHRLGLYGFGAAAHIVAQVAIHEGCHVYAFTRPGDTQGQDFARGLGAVWAGGSDQPPPQRLDAALIFAPVGALVPAALQAVDAGGVVVCGGIHMSDIPAMPYSLLWGERVLRSVANLTRADGRDFMAVAPRVPVVTTCVEYPLAAANRALDDLRNGVFKGAAVLRVDNAAA